MSVRRKPFAGSVSSILSAGLVVTVGACGPGGPPSPDGGLSFQLPASSTATYTAGDSLVISVDSPMGSLTMNMDSDMTLDMMFEQADGGVRVTATVAAFDASMNNPMTGRLSVDETNVDGPLVFVVGPDGDVTVATVPAVTGGAEQLRPFLSLPYELFPRFPRGAVAVGSQWVDTVAWSGSPDEGSFASTTAYTYTLQGDTAIAGTTLLRIAVAGETSLEGSMETGGFAIEQSLAGTTTGFYLWDPAAGLLHSAELNRSLEGSLRMPSMNLPAMPIRAEGPLRTRIQP
ncbi:MAG: hypothetical protein OEO23_00755 [Gemmatimonadota bacterium]|nr:hypothetical protein [Gemmatimonadota bacterium]